MVMKKCMIIRSSDSGFFFHYLCNTHMAVYCLLVKNTCLTENMVNPKLLISWVNYQWFQTTTSQTLKQAYQHAYYQLASMLPDNGLSSPEIHVPVGPGYHLS